jgi:ubiquinone/menaquinone biosynthesis C-methylase UbiE
MSIGCLIRTLFAWVAILAVGNRFTDTGRSGDSSTLPKSQQDATTIQREYYTETATQYDSMHANESADDPVVSQAILEAIRTANVESLLDVGSATGRGLAQLASKLQGMLVCGIEPVDALLKQAVASGVLRSVPLVRGSGDSLPFADESFDAVCEISILHHVPNPSVVVIEMMRVARKLVVIADCNRFGQGSLPARWLKLFLYKFGLWGAFNYVRTAGKHYQISEGDGLFYSYSVYDSYELVANWAERVVLVPLGPAKSKSWLHPLLTSESLILIAFRNAQLGTPGNPA